jgi:hypothetical protein
MRDIVLLDCNEIKCPKVLMFVFIELCEAFKELSYNVKIVTNINEITNNSIVFMGDGFTVPNVVLRLNTIAPNAIYIGWYWHKQNVSNLKYFIHTYENMLNPDNRVSFLQKQKHNCPLLLRASEHPDSIGTFKKNILYDYCYMGWRYCSEYVPSSTKFKGIYHGVTDHALFLPYYKRKDIYLASIFALGFQGDENIQNKHTSQRIFEGLAYGCVVLSNSLPACEYTNNIVVYITSKEDLENKMTFFKNNPGLIKQKQEEGYEFIRKCGTNHTSINLFMDCINQFSFP